MSEEIDNIFQGEKMRPITKDNFYSLNYRKAIVKEVTRVISIVHSFLFIIKIKPNKLSTDRWMDENFEPKKNS
ncbi:cytochrome P450 [Rhizophagus irregularis DAOM 181602=DAOM 197198]|nr:cytochrome P450 [Rhizophagus irregularis DAOM 181602=DAOM 197198]